MARQWEYHIEPIEGLGLVGKAGHRDRIRQGLAAMGQDGWELVAVNFGGSGQVDAVMIFKRPIEAVTEPGEIQVGSYLGQRG